MYSLFAYIKSHRFGSGHFSRVINIKKKLTSKRNIKLLNIAQQKDRASFLKLVKSKKIKILLDVSNKKFLKSHRKYFEKIQEIINQFKHELIIIDDVKSNSILNYFKKCNIKFYINPYIKNLKKKKFIENYFLGRRYLVGLNSYPKFQKRKKKIKNILIFLTGSKNKINFKLASFIREEFEFFSKFNISFISADYLDLKKKFNLKFIRFYNLLSIPRMSKLLAKNDIVLSGQGNFKYEIMMTGQPLIIITEKNFYLLLKKRLSGINVINIEKLIKIKNLLSRSDYFQKWEVKKKEKLFLKKIFS